MIYRHVILWKSTDFSEESSAIILRVKEQAKQESKWQEEIFQPWKWWHVSLKIWSTFSGVHCIMSQKIGLFNHCENLKLTACFCYKCSLKTFLQEHISTCKMAVFCWLLWSYTFQDLLPSTIQQQQLILFSHCSLCRIQRWSWSDSNMWNGLAVNNIHSFKSHNIIMIYLKEKVWMKSYTCSFSYKIIFIQIDVCLILNLFYSFKIIC